MLQDPTVKANMFSTDTYKAFYKTYMDGKPDYDYGLWAPRWPLLWRHPLFLMACLTSRLMLIWL